MSIKDTLRSDLTVAFKARNGLETDTLRAMIGAIETQEKSGKTAVVFSDEQILELMGRELKKRRESAQIYADANVPERAERETAEADFIATYLPAQLTEDEVRKIVTEVLTTFDNPTQSDFGSIMKQVTAETKGKAHGKLVSTLVREAL